MTYKQGLLIAVKILQEAKHFITIFGLLNFSVCWWCK